jgi:hypothetical protein
VKSCLLLWLEHGTNIGQTSWWLLLALASPMVEGASLIHPTGNVRATLAAFAIDNRSQQMTDATDDYWRINKRNFKRGLNRLGCLAFIICLLWLGGTAMPDGAEFFAQRTYAAQLLMLTQEVRATITQQLKDDPKASIAPALVERISSDNWHPGQCGASEPYSDWGFEPKYACIRIDDKVVLHDGTVIVYSQALKTMATWQPRVTENTVEWSCRMISELGDIAPQGCKP